MEHICDNKEIIEKLRCEIERLKIDIEVEKSNIQSVKDDIKDLKDNVKEMSANVYDGFKNADRKSIAMLTGIVMLLIGLIADIITR